ncbi:MAG: HAMP domain-containing protein, partial [Deltaproteobacteria bacterium]|nr:HAMP domain-containing protein [Deltaproteobacteria bacterium]
MLKKSLLSKILLTVIAINILGFSALIYKVIKAEEKNTLIEKAKSSELMAKPILHALYQNMLDQRADMARYLIDGTKAIEGVERVQVVRANGREEAFQDLKTIKKVEATLGTQNPDWRVNHPDNKDNVAKGVDDPRFIKFLEESLSNKLTDSTYYTEIVNGHRMQTYLMPIIKRDACNVCHQGLDGNGILMITSNIEDVYDTIAWNTKKWLFFGLVTIVLISLILTLLVRRIVTAPIGDTRDMLQEIAQGRGDLTKRLSVKSEDEVGTLSLWFNRFMEGMQDMIKEVVSTATRVLMSSASIKESTNGIKNAVQAQIFAVEETHNSITKMDGSIKDVSANAENLLVVAENASASTLELSATISDVAESVQHLSLSVGDTASAINEIAASLHQVSTHIDTLYNESESVASTSTEMDSTIKEVSMHTREQAELADKVKANASTIGIAAVDKTIKGIENIRSHVNQTSEVIDRLGERSSDIGHIVGVIDEVAETTNLLALNATILAAQAGKHGKGF